MSLTTLRSRAACSPDGGSQAPRVPLLHWAAETAQSPGFTQDWEQCHDLPCPLCSQVFFHLFYYYLDSLQLKPVFLEWLKVTSTSATGFVSLLPAGESGHTHTCGRCYGAETQTSHCRKMKCQRASGQGSGTTHISHTVYPESGSQEETLPRPGADWGCGAPTVHFHQKLVERLLFLRVGEARHGGGALLAHSVDLVNVDDAGSPGPGFLEEAPHAGSAKA